MRQTLQNEKNNNEDVLKHIHTPTTHPHTHCAPFYLYTLAHTLRHIHTHTFLLPPPLPFSRKDCICYSSCFRMSKYEIYSEGGGTSRRKVGLCHVMKTLSRMQVLRNLLYLIHLIMSLIPFSLPSPISGRLKPFQGFLCSCLIDKHNLHPHGAVHVCGERPW